MIRSKWPNIGTSIFSVMSDLAAEHNAINLAQGFPDFNPEPELVNLVAKYMKSGNNQYAPMPGLMKLREKISEKVENIYESYYNPDTEITITSGASEAIFSTISAIVRENDEVIIFEPAYDSYAPVVRINGATPIHISLKLPDYKIDWDELNKVITSRTRMIIINSPHNPSGTIIESSSIDRLIKLVSNSNIYVLSDEVYEHIVFDNLTHESIAKYKNLRDRSIIVSSFGKTYHTTGWKLGYCLADKDVTKEIRKVHQFNVFAVNTPIQHAFAEYIDKKEIYLQISDFYKQKRDEFLKLIDGSKFTFTPSVATYFQLLDYSNISTEKAMDFATRLIKEYGLASVPVSAFYHNKFDIKALRFCFAKDSETLKRASEIIHKISDKEELQETTEKDTKKSNTK